MPTLIVDDVRAPRRVLRKLLGELGINKVDEASSGKEALDLLKEKQFSLILCDFHLNDTTALEVLRSVRMDERHQEIPFLIITSDVLKEELIQAREAGVSGYLLKPFSLDALADNLGSILPSANED